PPTLPTPPNLGAPITPPDLPAPGDLLNPIRPGGWPTIGDLEPPSAGDLPEVDEPDLGPNPGPRPIDRPAPVGVIAPVIDGDGTLDTPPDPTTPDLGDRPVAAASATAGGCAPSRLCAVTVAVPDDATVEVISA